METVLAVVIAVLVALAAVLYKKQHLLRVQLHASETYIELLKKIIEAPTKAEKIKAMQKEQISCAKGETDD